MMKDSQPVDAIVWEDPSHSKRVSDNCLRIFLFRYFFLFFTNAIFVLLQSVKGTVEESDMIDVEKHTEPDVTTEDNKCEPSSVRKFMLSGIKVSSQIHNVYLTLPVLLLELYNIIIYNR